MVHSHRLDLAFGALADPVRRAVLMHLQRGDQAVSVLAAQHEMSLPGFAKHVRTLERAGLVTTTKAGRVRMCRLSEPGLAAAEWLRTYRAFWEQQLESLDRHLQADATEKTSRTETQEWTAPRRSRSKSAGSSPRPPRAPTTRGRRRSS